MTELEVWLFLCRLDGAPPAGGAVVGGAVVVGDVDVGPPVVVGVVGETPGVTVICGDFQSTETLESVERTLAGRQADVVISDMAPNLSGVASVDQARSIGLAELALDFALKHLKPQGKFLVKMFQGAGYEQYVAALRRRFSSVQIRKPNASRSRSSEVYLVGKGLREIVAQ